MTNTDIRKAIKSLLADDSELATMLSGAGAIYHRKAPQRAVAPYVIFFKQSGIETYAFKGKAYKNMLWLVKGVCRGGDAEVAEQIDARCTEVLNDAELNIADADTLVLYRVDDVSYDEVDNGEQVHNEGGSYRVVVQPT